MIDLIDTFLDLVATRSFNRSADRLGVTQSTVSARIKALEAALGATLFNRSRAGTDLTTEGLRFEAHARRLRQDWTEAKRATASSGEAALTLRLGIQFDLAVSWLPAFVADLRRALPQTAWYIEPDYSTQMCNDLTSGVLDFALMFSPKPHPDLHFHSVGELQYRLVSSDAALLAQIDPGRVVFANFSPAFETAHRQALPGIGQPALSVGTSTAAAELLRALGGSAYVLGDTATALIASGRFQAVQDAPGLTQPVFAAMHLRNRTARLHRRLTRLAGRHLKPDSVA